MFDVEGDGVVAALRKQLSPRAGELLFAVGGNTRQGELVRGRGFALGHEVDVQELGLVAELSVAFGDEVRGGFVAVVFFREVDFSHDNGLDVQSLEQFLVRG